MTTRLRAAAAILRGAMTAIRDPRKLARLTWTSPDERESDYEAEARRLIGGAPRSVPIERVMPLDSAQLDVFSFLDDTSTVLDLMLLRGLLARYERPRYLEIGTFRGESALAAASEGAEVVTISLPDEELRARGAHESWIEAHRTFSQGHPSIRHLHADSQSVDLGPFQNWADVLFIDGDHARLAVEHDTRRFWPVRARNSGVV
ncbi:MAG TPA: class I SAM-dependent methyltransferase, partial [Gemmatimonadaceae bacterium]|nr:class I SAM-dependent methyltransferase [Gemmatimonadaceae bacterium]